MATMEVVSEAVASKVVPALVEVAFQVEPATQVLQVKILMLVDHLVDFRVVLAMLKLLAKTLTPVVDSVDFPEVPVTQLLPVRTSMPVV